MLLITVKFASKAIRSVVAMSSQRLAEETSNTALELACIGLTCTMASDALSSFKLVGDLLIMEVETSEIQNS